MGSTGWSEPKLVGSDAWHYPACPVNGPQLDAFGNDVVLAWFAAPEDEARVQVAFSDDGGGRFGQPTRVDEGMPLGRVDVELLDDGSAIVIWLETVGEEAEIRARRVYTDGTAGASWLISPTSRARGSGFPRMTRVGGEIVLAWTELGDAGGVRVVSVSLD